MLYTKPVPVCIDCYVAVTQKKETALPTSKPNNLAQTPSTTDLYNFVPSDQSRKASNLYMYDSPSVSEDTVKNEKHLAREKRLYVPSVYETSSVNPQPSKGKSETDSPKQQQSNSKSETPSTPSKGKSEMDSPKGQPSKNAYEVTSPKQPSNNKPETSPKQQTSNSGTNEPIQYNNNDLPESGEKKEKIVYNNMGDPKEQTTYDNELTSVLEEPREQMSQSSKLRSVEEDDLRFANQSLQNEAARGHVLGQTVLRDWNKTYQELLVNVRSCSSSTNRFAYRALNQLIQEFTDTATLYAEIIISEMCLPQDMKTIKAIDVGGVAGGL